MDIDKQLEHTEEQPEEAGSRNELVLDNWKLILIFFVGLVICVIFFAAGLIVGRHQPRVPESVQNAPEIPAPTRTQAAAPAAKVRENPPPPRETPVEVHSRPEPVAEPAAPAAPPPVPTTIAQTHSETAEAPAEPLGEPPVAAAGPAAPPAPGPPAKAAKPEGAAPVFRVQIAAMKTMPEAQAVVEKLKKKGFDSFIVSPKNPSDVYYRIQMGEFTERAAAQEVILKLQEAGEKPVLKRQ